MNRLRSTTTIDFGLGHNWEVGANLYNLNYQPSDHYAWQRNDTTTEMPYAPLLLINTQRTFELTKSLHVGIGGQTGINIFPTQKSSWCWLGLCQPGR